MIRDLTKSMLSFSWGMSLFGMSQLINSLTPEKATGAFNAVTRETEQQLSDMLKGAFRAGDQLQRGLVDMTFSFLMLDALSPTRMAKMASDMAQQGPGASGRSAQRVPMGSQERATGWGPVSTPGAPGQATQARPAGTQERATGWGPIPPPGVK